MRCWHWVSVSQVCPSEPVPVLPKRREAEPICPFRVHSVVNPEYRFIDHRAVPWTQFPATEGIEVKTLPGAGNQKMELYRFAPNTVFPDHIHVGPEFVFMLEGSARVNNRWIESGWCSAAETGTHDLAFQSGNEGCVFLTVYTEGSHYLPSEPA